MSARILPDIIQRVVPSNRSHLTQRSFHFKKATPKRITTEVLARYGQWIDLGAVPDTEDPANAGAETTLEFSKTEFYRKIESHLTPGKWLKNLREANGYSQNELGAMIGNKKPVRASRVSDWESGFRAISKPVAKKLAVLFHVSADRFI